MIDTRSLDLGGLGLIAPLITHTTAEIGRQLSVCCAMVYSTTISAPTTVTAATDPTRSGGSSVSTRSRVSRDSLFLHTKS